MFELDAMREKELTELCTVFSYYDIGIILHFGVPDQNNRAECIFPSEVSTEEIFILAQRQ